MEGFSLLLGHLLGDYIFQRDWEAGLKTKQPPEGVRPRDYGLDEWPSIGHICEQSKWDDAVLAARTAPAACLYHCAMYTLAVFLAAWWCLPWWAYPVIFATHYPVDRWRLARRFVAWNGQEEFATKLFAPWSVVVVDNVFHLVVLYLVMLPRVLQ